MKKLLYILLFIAVIAVLIFIGIRLQAPDPVVSTAQSSTEAPIAPEDITKETKLGANVVTDNLPTTQVATVSCSLITNIVTDKDGNKQAQLSWDITPGAIAYIPGLETYIKAIQPIGNVTGPIITKATSYTLVVSDGIATSTCQTTATP